MNGGRLSVAEPREWQFTGVGITYEGNNLVSIFFDTGEMLHVQVKSSVLIIELADLPLEFTGKTKGLLGNFNGDPSDDFLRPDGTVLPTDASAEDIHYLFGEECKC